MPEVTLAGFSVRLRAALGIGTKKVARFRFRRKRNLCRASFDVTQFVKRTAMRERTSMSATS
jgi:hypothetical protein